jgi:hypothetical protein
MSYDLHFLRQEASKTIPPDAFLTYFGNRRGYEVKGSQIWYENEDTGVYFSFDLESDNYDDPELEDDEDEELLPPKDGLTSAGLSFNINYFRPHFFGLEAEVELSALVAEFGLLVDDPQSEGMDRGAYSGEGFLRGWNAGNRFGYLACMSPTPDGQRPVTPGSLARMPRAVLEAQWRWNFERHGMQEIVGEEAYMSLIRPFRIKGRASSFVVWGDAISQAIPEVEYLVLVRKDFAPRKLFGGKKQDICLVEFSSLKPLLGLATRREEPVAHYVFSHDEPPPRLAEFFRSQRAFADQLDGLSWDKVLTAELVDETEVRVQRGAGT